MAARLDEASSSGIAEINVIPLVDIILVVLIIFMVAAPLVMKPKIEIQLPKSTSSKDKDDKKSLQVVLGKNGELFVNNQVMTIAGLTSESRLFATHDPEGSALLVADKAATLEMITDLVDAIKSGGVKKVAFSVQKK